MYHQLKCGHYFIIYCEGTCDTGEAGVETELSYLIIIKKILIWKNCQNIYLCEKGLPR